jgi:hypothetical protein
MTDLEEFDAWFEREYNAAAVAPSLRHLAFHFWREGRRSVLAASGSPVEMRCLPEAT